MKEQGDINNQVEGIKNLYFTSSEGEIVRWEDTLKYIISLMDKGYNISSEIKEKLLNLVDKFIARGGRVEEIDYLSFADILKEMKEEDHDIEIDPDKVLEFSQIEKLNNQYKESPNDGPEDGLLTPKE